MAPGCKLLTCNFADRRRIQGRRHVPEARGARAPLADLEGGPIQVSHLNGGRAVPSLVGLACAWILAASAEDAKADWWIQTPPEQCVSRNVISERIQSELSEPPAFGGPDKVLRVEIQQPRGLVVISVFRGEEAIGERRIAHPGASCDDLVSLAVLISVTILEGHAALEATSMTLPSHESPSRLSTPPPGTSDSQVGSVSWH